MKKDHILEYFANNTCPCQFCQEHKGQWVEIGDGDLEFLTSYAKEKQEMHDLNGTELIYRITRKMQA